MTQNGVLGAVDAIRSDSIGVPELIEAVLQVVASKLTEKVWKVGVGFGVGLDNIHKLNVLRA